MSGTKMGSIKAKLGLRGKTKPGDMISAMNSKKSAVLKSETVFKGKKGMEYKAAA